MNASERSPCRGAGGPLGALWAWAGTQVGGEGGARLCGATLGVWSGCQRSAPLWGWAEGEPGPEGVVKRQRSGARSVPRRGGPWCHQWRQVGRSCYQMSP